MKKFGYILFLSVCLLLTTSCEKDDEISANFEMEFVELQTDHTGTAFKLTTDQNESFNIINQLSGLKADTIYRFVTVFVREANGVRLTNYTPAVSGKPDVFEKTPIVTNPVTFQSMWRGGHYLNATVQVVGKEKRHAFAYMYQGLKQKTDGHRILNLLLYHNADNDMEAFSRTAYLSCDLADYKDSLQTGRDSIFFTINEYNKGFVIHKIPY